MDMDASPLVQTTGALQYSTISTLSPPPQGRKLSRKSDEPTEASRTKRMKSESSRRGRPARVRLPRPSKVNAAAKAALKEKARDALATQPKWKLSVHSIKSREIVKGIPVTVLKPRLWTSDKEELLAILPEMCGPKCVNGVSWLLYENPMLILDDTNAFFEAHKVDDITIDLITTRSFTCPVIPESRSEFDESLSSMMLLNSSEEEKPVIDVIQTPPTPSQRGNTDDFVQFHEHTSTSAVIPPWGNHGDPTVRDEWNSRSEVQSAANSDTRLSSYASQPYAIDNEASNYEMAFYPPLRCHSEFAKIPSKISTSKTCPSRNYSPVVVHHLAGSMRLGQLEMEANIEKMEQMTDGDLLPMLTNALGVGSIPDRCSLPMYKKPDFFTNISEKRSGKRREYSFSSFPDEVAQPMKLGLHIDLESSEPHRHASLGDQSPKQRAYTAGTGPSSGLLSDLVGRSHHATVENFESLVDEKSLPVPSPIPQELQALVDAFVFGKPLTVVASNQRFYDIWSLLLPKEYGYVMLGFFRILGVEEHRIQSHDPKPVSTVSKDYGAGHVRWRFRLQWSPGGEEGIWPDRRDELTHAWWSPLPRCLFQGKGNDTETDTKGDGSNPEDSFPTTPKYRELRTQNSEYKWRRSPLQDKYYCLFPAHLLMPFTSQLPDINFPRGWICSTCGRMNFQAAIRHRKCPGPLCKHSKLIAYYHDLFLLRDPQDRLTLPLPCNSYPHERVDVKHIKWEDGTQTFSCFVPDSIRPMCYMKHVFLGNLPFLQRFADEWLKTVQLELEIIRRPGDNGPYFSYSASFRQRKVDPNVTKWPNVPAFVNDMKDIMLFRAKWYGEVKGQDLRFDQFSILAWITSGSKKSPQPIRAKKKAALLLCLGSNVVLNINPYSNRNQAFALQPRIDDQEENTQGHAGWITKDRAEDSIEDFLHDRPSKKPITASKRVPHSFTFSLVHGDALIVFGDDFEYTIKRDGTAFLLMASCSGSDE